MPVLLIVYHSTTGGAAQMARAALCGARHEDGVHTRLIAAPDATADDLLGADAYLFVAPENLAAISGVMKDFFDRTYYAVLERINGRPYAVMVCAGSDGSNAARQMARIATGWRLREIGAALIVCTDAQTAEQILAPKTISKADLQHCEELGQALATGLAAGIF